LGVKGAGPDFDIIFLNLLILLFVKNKINWRDILLDRTGDEEVGPFRLIVFSIRLSAGSLYPV
jgi:hypothetical protein